jgi:hypothetical protein
LVGPRESVIENAVVKAILARGGVIDKVTSLSRRGFFDRIAVLNGVTYLIETKRPRGGKLSKHQVELHAAYRAAGANVVVVRSELELADWLSTLIG